MGDKNVRELRGGLRALICVLVLTTFVHAAGRESDGWLTDYETARVIARRSGKPLFVVFRCEH
jgi:hypothetical protein